MKKGTFADRVIAYNRELNYEGELPAGYAVINPFKNNPNTMPVMEAFYRKYYNDNHQRRLIAGINPGRFGAAVTGVPFTDTKRLYDVCGIKMEHAHSHEPSSVFVYELIKQYGGVSEFFGDFYINSPFPLAIVRQTPTAQLNANYYDDKNLMQTLFPFMVKTLKDHISMGLNTSDIYIMGKKNAESIKQINDREQLFENIYVLEHPRYIQQYKSKYRDEYIHKYLEAFKKQANNSA